MTVDSLENKKLNDFSNGWQTFIFRFVVVAAILLIALPILPTLSSNLVYSFSGASPKIYWYLSRASGFVTLTILWISMALGLGISNKIARLWPGAPTAFAMHEFTSLLGLAFSAYHALVLMGDHFVDFSLPRLAVPFSIAYQTFWVGLGQLCFYLWVLVVITFYFRQRIGQKTWRLIHYVNFAVYIMGFLHGLKSGTDSHDTWAIWYFVISGLSILILLGYRINDVLLKKRISLPKLTFPQLPPLAEKFSTYMRAISQIKMNLPSASILWDKAKKLVPKRKPMVEQILERIEASPAPEMPSETGSAKEVSRENSPVKLLEGTIHGEKIRVRIFKEPTEDPMPESQREAKSKQQAINTLSENTIDSLSKLPAESIASDRPVKEATFPED